MIFNLLCPECLTENNVESVEMNVIWVCNNCATEITTSLGVDENGDLING